MTNSILAHLLVASLQGGLFVLAVWLVCRSLKRLPAVWKCWLWRLTSAKFVVGLALAATIPVVVPTPVRNSPIVSAVQRAQTLPTLEPELSYRPLRTPYFQGNFGRPTRAAALHPDQPVKIVTELSEAPPSPAFNYRDWLVGIWLCGLLVMVGRAVAACRKVGKLLASKQIIDSERFEGLVASSRLGRKVSVKVVDNLSAPALLGFLSPAIAIPAHAETASNGAMQSAIAHEIAHLKRNDIAWMLIAEAIKAVFWFHPLAWVGCREQRIESEIAADELARKWTQIPPRTYAVHLLEWIDPSRTPPKPLPFAPGALSSTHELTRRVKEMSLSRYPRSAAAALGSILVFPLAAGLAPVMLVGGNHGLSQTPWPKFQGNFSNTGQGQGTPATGRQKWKVEMETGGGGAPSIGPNGLVYFGTEDGQLRALDGSTGKARWMFKTDNLITSSPAVGANGLLYFGSQDGTIYAISAKTGQKKWEYPTEGLVYGSPAVGDDGTVYVGSWDGNLYALNGQTGAERWIFPTGGPITGSPALGPDGTVYVGSHNHSLYALDGSTGVEKWSFEAGDALNSPAVAPDGTVFAGSWDGKLYALDGSTGAKKWAYQTGGQVDSCPAIGSDGLVYIGSSDQQVYGIDAKTGEQKWAFATKGPVESSPVIGGDGTVYIGSCDGNFYALVGATGWKKWQIDTGEQMEGPAAIGSDGTLYFDGSEGVVYAIH